MRAVLLATITCIIAYSPFAQAYLCTEITSGMLAQDAVWSPDGQSLAFHAGDGIYTIPAAAGATPTLVVPYGDDPSWSPDGTKLVFAHLDDIWTVDLGTGYIQQITTGPAAELHPDWSWDGDKIVYVHRPGDPGNDESLHVYSFSAGTHTRVTFDFYLNLHRPAWHPDGTEIVYGQFMVPEGVDVFLVDYPPPAPEVVLFDWDDGVWDARWHPLGNELVLVRHGFGGRPGAPRDRQPDCVVRYDLSTQVFEELECREPRLRTPDWARNNVEAFSFIDDTSGNRNLVICRSGTSVEQTSWGVLKALYVDP
jgi:dipeptidyl aminopeptidase/acylaminoacyl peptidase